MSGTFSFAKWFEDFFSGVDDTEHKHPWYAPGTAPIASPCGTLGITITSIADIMIKTLSRPFPLM